MIGFMLDVVGTGLSVAMDTFLIVGCLLIGFKIAVLTQQIITNVLIAFVVSVILAAITGAFVGAIADWVREKYRQMFVYEPILSY